MLTRNRALTTELLLAVAVTAVSLIVWRSQLLGAAERRALDRRFQMRHALPAGDDIVVIAIDDFSLSHLGKWPWSRDMHATVIDRLTEAGAKLIVFDVLFAEYAEAEGDDYLAEQDRELAAAVERSGRVIVPTYFSPGGDSQSDDAWEGAGDEGGDAGVIHCIPEVEDAAVGTGHMVVETDEDGILRRTLLYAQAPLGRWHPSFALVAAARYLGAKLPAEPPAGGLRLGETTIPVTTAEGRAWTYTNFFGASADKAFATIPYVNVYYGDFTPKAVSGRIALIGTTAAGIGESFHRTPLAVRQPWLPGTLVHANAIESLVRGATPRSPSPVWYGLVLALFSFLFTFGALSLLRRNDSAVIGLVAALFVGLVWWVEQRWFAGSHVWLEFYPFVTTAVLTLALQMMGRVKDALQEALRRQRQLESVARAGAHAVSRSSLSEDFEVALNSALSVSDSQVGALWAIDETEKELTVKAVAGIDAAQVRTPQAHRGAGWIGAVVATGQPQAVDIRNAGEPAPAPFAADFRSQMLVPLMAQGRCVGVLGLARPDGRGFGEEQLRPLRAIAAQAGLDIDNAMLVEKRQKMYLDSLAALVRALERRDAYTRGHSDRVTQYGVQVAQTMDLPPDRVELVRLSGSVHDIGKIGVPDAILNKPGRLDRDEYELLKMHAQWTGDILEEIDWMPEVRWVAMHHHEKVEGTGYPDGLTRDEMPLEARILAVTDCYDAMTSNRPYRDGMPPENALRIMTEVTGTQLDEEVMYWLYRTPDAHWTEACGPYLEGSAFTAEVAEAK